jgi:urease accessory protein UreE
VTIRVDGEDVQLIPIRSAHTDRDTLVSFPKHDILAVGDYFLWCDRQRFVTIRIEKNKNAEP